MTNTELLEDLIKKSGYKKSYIAKAIGRSIQALNNKIKNESEFTGTELAILCLLLEINTFEAFHRVFFNQKVELNSTELGQSATS